MATFALFVALDNIFFFFVLCEVSVLPSLAYLAANGRSTLPRQECALTSSYVRHYVDPALSQGRTDLNHLKIDKITTSTCNRNKKY